MKYSGIFLKGIETLFGSRLFVHGAGPRSNWGGAEKGLGALFCTAVCRGRGVLLLMHSSGVPSCTVVCLVCRVCRAAETERRLAAFAAEGGPAVTILRFPAVYGIASKASPLQRFLLHPGRVDFFCGGVADASWPNDTPPVAHWSLRAHTCPQAWTRRYVSNARRNQLRCFGTGDYVFRHAPVCSFLSKSRIF